MTTLHRHVGALALALGIGTCLAQAAGGAEIGANDDTGKYASDNGAAFYERMAAVGLRQTVITVRWKPSDPLGILESGLLEDTIPAAEGAGLKVVLAVYPYPPRELDSGIATPTAFGSWLERLARRYPTVRQYVVGNEPNQPAFFRPQFGRTGKPLSAARFGPYLAAGYDTLKALDPELTVVGVGLSPRGNDRPFARSNVSTSPVRWLAALGRWYRSTGRDRPLMDGLSFHPYPNHATDPLVRGYPWPNAGFVNLDRIRQAVWDAFAGTSQPTTLDGLRLYLDEVGWQVDTSTNVAYTGFENVRVTTEARQASIYGELVRRATCEPDLAELNLFGFYDDPLRSGFQAALFRADGFPRPAVEVVRTAIAEATSCLASVAAWTPLRKVRGVTAPRVARRGDLLDVRIAAGEGARVIACVVPGPSSPELLGPRLRRSTARTPGCAVGAIISSIRPLVLRLPRSSPGTLVGARLVAESNPRRVTVVHLVFR